MDATFCICNRKILLFNILVVDSRGKGIPVAYFLFTPKYGAKLDSSSYDTSILANFLTKFKAAVTEAHRNEFPEDASEFFPLVISDYY